MKNMKNQSPLIASFILIFALFFQVALTGAQHMKGAQHMNWYLILASTLAVTYLILCEAKGHTYQNRLYRYLNRAIVPVYTLAFVVYAATAYAKTETLDFQHALWGAWGIGMLVSFALHIRAIKHQAQAYKDEANKYIAREQVHHYKHTLAEQSRRAPFQGVVDIWSHAALTAASLMIGLALLASS